MNFNLFDDLDGLVLHERENAHMRNSAAHYNKSAAPLNGNTSAFPASTPLAMAYVPFQQFNEIYPENEALKKGTLFPELCFPFMKGGSFNE